MSFCLIILLPCILVLATVVSLVLAPCMLINGVEMVFVMKYDSEETWELDLLKRLGPNVS